jgi:hypothetical protein
MSVFGKLGVIPSRGVAPGLPFESVPMCLRVAAVCCRFQHVCASRSMLRDCFVFFCLFSFSDLRPPLAIWSPKAPPATALGAMAATGRGVALANADASAAPLFRAAVAVGVLRAGTIATAAAATTATTLSSRAPTILLWMRTGWTRWTIFLQRLVGIRPHLKCFQFLGMGITRSLVRRRVLLQGLVALDRIPQACLQHCLLGRLPFKLLRSAGIGPETSSASSSGPGPSSASSSSEPGPSVVGRFAKHVR